MDYSLITFFLVVVLFGSYFQSVTGFAMGMIIVSLLGGLRIVDIPVLTAVISLLTMVNVILALKGRFHEVCLLYTSPSPRDVEESRMPSSA